MAIETTTLFLRPVKILLLIGAIFWSAASLAQAMPDSLQKEADSLRRADSLQRLDSLVADSLSKLPPPIRDTMRPVMQYAFTSDSFRFLRPRPFFSFTNPVRYTISVREWRGKEAVFYCVVGLLLVFAFIKNSFQRYLSDLFSSYFRTTVRQRQVKEQLLQNPLPSLLFNVFFVISAALFVSLLVAHFSLADSVPFWMIMVYSALALALIYGGKYVVLKFFGWVFRHSAAVETYLFVVFSTNKVLAVLLLPFTILLAFTEGSLREAAVTLGLVLVGSLFIYRFFLAWISINRMVSLNLFHFLVYLAAFEIVPLLLINKLLFLFLHEIS